MSALFEKKCEYLQHLICRYFLKSLEVRNREEIVKGLMLSRDIWIRMLSIVLHYATAP